MLNITGLSEFELNGALIGLCNPKFKILIKNDVWNKKKNDPISALSIGFLFYWGRKNNCIGLFFISSLPYKNNELLDVHKAHIILAKVGAGLALKELKKYFIGTILFSPLLYFNIWMK